MSLPTRARRQVFISYSILALALIVAMFGTLTAPVSARVAFFASLDAQRTTYAKSLEALARSEAFSAQFELRQAASDTTSHVFHAATPALAGAELQNQLTALVGAEGGALLSSAFRESSAEGPLTLIAITARLHCSMDALLRILHGLENRAPALFVENLTVQARQRSGSPERQSDGDLDVELEVFGFFHAQAAL